MARSAVAEPTSSRYWIALVVRAVLALVIAAVVTFSADHSPEFGLTVFALFALPSGIATALLARRAEAASHVDALSIRLIMISGALTAVAGIIALIVRTNGTSALMWLIVLWAAITGATEFVAGLRARKTLAAAREWLAAGAFGLILAIAVLLVPGGLDQHFVGPDGVERSLTSAVVTVGMFGAYAAVLGVYLLIGGLSLKWGASADRRTEATPVESSS